jgi:DNA-binding transcriptional LysR family regulator
VAVVVDLCAGISVDRGAVIEVRHLRYFLVVAEELHFGRAAERLGMGQSPLSQQIRQLEGELGVVLVERGHRVEGLTDAGKVFFRAAKSLLGELDRAVEQTKRAGHGEFGTILIGYVGEVTADLLPLSLKCYKELSPGIGVDLVQNTTGELLDALRRRQVDVAFVRHPGAIDELEYQQLLEEPLFAAWPNGHALSGERRSLRDLSNEPFVLPAYPIAQGLRRDIDASCSNAGFTPIVSREASPLTAVLLLVAAGAGVALVPASVAHSYPVPGVDLTKLSDAPMTNVGIAWRRNESSHIITNFLEVTREIAKEKAQQSDVWPERRVKDPGEHE